MYEGVVMFESSANHRCFANTVQYCTVPNHAHLRAGNIAQLNHNHPHRVHKEITTYMTWAPKIHERSLAVGII